mmetsp:Transcript_86216/g.248843  ORF Transcript_86216/g.248843 Transcript_86216/m.248843 type:complete len:335 (+) Transcript_86216:591-1595(+)
MSMASFTATSPSLASLTIWRLTLRSASRCLVASASSLFKSSISLVKSSISSTSSTFLRLRPLSSTSNLLVSAWRKSRSFFAMPSSSSQKPFLFASAVASARRRSMSFWMRTLTWSKGPSATCIDSEARAALLKRRPSAPNNFATPSRRACAVNASTFAPRSSTERPRPPETEASCSKESAPCGDTGARAAPAAGVAALEAVAPRWASSARWTEVRSRSVTVLLRISSAPVNAANSSARICERWSQSAARTSQRSVMSFMNSWSSFSIASALTNSPRACAMSPVRVAMSPSNMSIASLLAFSLSLRSSMVSSKFALALAHSDSSSDFSARNSFNN